MFNNGFHELHECFSTKFKCISSIMNKNIYKLLCAGLVGFGLAACSPDDFNGADPNGLPSLSGEDFTLVVDQEVNQIQVSYPEKDGVYPIWLFNGATYSTLNNAGWANTEAGTYTVEMKLGNRNGISQSSITKTFTFNESKVNYNNLFNRITGKEWRIDYGEVAHLACGPYGGDGTGWWSAAPEEKKDFGVYDDRITFTAETNKGGTYTYNPGPDGMTYVNTGTTHWGSESADFDAPTQEQSASWYFQRGKWTDSEGQVIDVDYLVLAPNTLFPYISSDEQYANPRFRIETLTASKMVLVYENEGGGISWRFILTSKDEVKAFEGFDPNSDFNLWKGITPNMTFYYNPDPGWGNDQTALFESLFEMGNNDYNVTIPNQCYAQWQAQVHFHTNIATQASSHYDFSLILNSDKDLGGVTIKLTDEADGNDFFFAEQVDLKAGQDYIVWKSDFDGIDFSQVKLVLDFGFSGDDTHVNVRNIVLKDHANDDGTILPDDNPVNPDAPVMDWDYNSNANLWKAVDDGTLFDAFGYWFADNNWSQISNSECVHSGDTYEITLPEGMGGSQWQGQFHIDTKLTASASKAYNFYLVMEADNDCPQVTFKLTDAGDSNYFIEERNDVKAGEPFILKREAVTLKEGLDAEAIRLFFDFGGSPAGTNVKISKIYFEEAVVLNYDDADNLWKAVDDGSKFDAFGYWFADNNWSQISNSDCVHSGNTYELTLPEGMGGSQWQGQFHIDTKLTASAAKEYHFQLTMEVDQDCPGVTIKLTDAGDTNFFCEGRHDIKADEPFVYTLKNATLKEGNDADAIRLFFDFGGSPAGTNVKISKIIFKEAN